MKGKIHSAAELSWSQRFALIAAYEPSEEQVLEVFQCSKQDYDNALELKEQGIFKVDDTINVAPYGELFGKPSVQNTTKATKPSGPSMKSKAEPKKRGRKGDKIQKAFASIGTEPVLVADFLEEHQISLAVLRQSKRFDQTGLGTVHVKKNGEGELIVWREAAQEGAGIAQEQGDIAMKAEMDDGTGLAIDGTGYAGEEDGAGLVVTEEAQAA